MNTTDKIKVMQAFADGAEIEFKSDNIGCWLSTTCPIWNWSTSDYRVKINEPFWEPKRGQVSYRITTINKDNIDVIKSECWSQVEVDLGILYKTREDAEQAVKVKLAEQRLKKAIYTANGNQQCNFIVGKDNWHIILDNGALKTVYANYTKILPNWYFCKNKEIAEQILQEHKDDLLTYLNQ